MEFTDKPWDGSASRWETAADYAKSCLINLNTGDSKDWTKDNCKLPVKEPDGTVNKNAVHSAVAALAGGRGGVDAPPAVKKSAARQLRRLYAAMKEDLPPSIKAML